jgi:4-amino-4-deoxy-L-arabinose transferase-like glycosyltransferase
MLKRLSASRTSALDSTEGGTNGSPRFISTQISVPVISPLWNSPALHSTAIFALAFLIRLQLLSEMAPHPLLDINLVRGTDMEGYIQWGRRIAEGNWLGRGEGPFYQGPAYPYFLALTFTVFGFAAFPALAAQAVLGSLSPVLIYWVGRHTFSPAVGLAAGLMAAAYGMLVFFGLVLHSTTLEVFLTCVALLALAIASRRGEEWWFWAGAAAALAALARPNLLIIPPFVIAAIIIRGWGRPAKSLAKASGFFLAGFILVIGPVTLRNVVIGKQFVILSSAGPETFRIANSYDSTPLNFRYPQLPQMPVTSWAFWRHQVVKAVLFWWGFEVPQNVNYYWFREHSRVLAWPSIPYWIVVPLAWAGVGAARRSWRELLPIGFFGLGYYLSVVAFHIVGRFRLPLVPILLPLAAHAVVLAWKLGRERQWLRLAPGLMGVLTLTLLVRPWGFPLVYPVDHANYGYILANRGELAGAVRELGIAEQAMPGYPNLNYDMGRMLVVLGRPGEAMARFEREMQNSPPNPEVFRRAGLLAGRRIGDPDLARKYLEQYLVLVPEGARAQEVRQVLESLRSRPGDGASSEK